MARNRDTLYLFILATLALAGLIALVALGRDVPRDLWTLAGLFAGGIVGVARQDGGGTSNGATVNLPNAVAPRIAAGSPAAVDGAEGMGSDVSA